MTDASAAPAPVRLSQFGRSPGFKFFLISFLILLLLVPLLFVLILVSEREGRANEVRVDVARTWGGQQQIAGPFLVVPYAIRAQVRDGDKLVEQTIERRAVFLPDDLTIAGSAASKVLHRSIFDVNVFTAKLAIDGRFATPEIADVDQSATAFRWRDATLVMRISDVAGLKEAATVRIDGQDTLPFAPSIPGLATNGIHAKLGQSAALTSPTGTAKGFSFHLDLVFSGSAALSFAPAARETNVALASDWPHPSFMGAFLPVDRSVAPEGFKASWRVPHLARSVPSAWSIEDSSALDRFSAYMFGVSFIQPVDFYDTVNRAVKYAILFLGAGFMGVFVLELMSRKRVHPVQYLFVGLSMVFFYVLLLSFAEHIGFERAYLVASIATGGVLSLYVGKVLGSARQGLVMLTLFLFLYGLLYLILQLEDYALLAGAILGFFALSGVMFATLKVDWAGTHFPEPTGPQNVSG